MHTSTKTMSDEGYRRWIDDHCDIMLIPISAARYYHKDFLIMNLQGDIVPISKVPIKRGFLMGGLPVVGNKVINNLN